MTDRRKRVNVAFSIIIHFSITIFVQAILFSQEIWWYDNSLKYIIGNLCITLIILSLDFFAVKKLLSNHIINTIHSILIHFMDLLLLLPVILMFFSFSKEFSNCDSRIITLLVITTIADGLLLLERILQHVMTVTMCHKES